MPSKSKPGSIFFLTCSGCRNSKSVSVSASLSETSDKTEKSSSTMKTTSRDPKTHYSFSSAHDDAASSTTPTFSGLLHQLSELERDVIKWAPQAGNEKLSRSRHRRCRSEGRLEEESVAVVKESKDPLVDFRRSMLQMIVEKEIVDGAGLRELLQKFLELNSRRNHYVILKAFAEIWNEVFVGYKHSPELLRRSRGRIVAIGRGGENEG